MDNIDKKLLSILADNSRVTASDLVGTLNLSVPSINKRIAKLQKNGVIRKFTINIDPKSIGKQMLTFMLVYIDNCDADKMFKSHVADDPDIVECYSVSGEYDYLMKVYSRDMEEIEKKISYMKRELGVTKSFTMFSIYEVFSKPTVLP